MNINSKYVKPNWRTVEMKMMRDGFGEAVLEMGEKEEELVVLTADLGGSTRVLGFRDKYPERYFNVGVAEQNMLGVAAGLAKEGLIPMATSYGVFSPARNWSQLRVSVCMSEANVKLVGGHGGLGTGEDGATHQALEDLAITRVLPNLKVFSPCDFTQTKELTKKIIREEGPCYLRLFRPESRNFTKRQTMPIGRQGFESEKIHVYKKGNDLSLFVTGIFVWDALMVAERLAEEGIEVEVLNVSSIKPIDKERIVSSMGKTGKAVSLEDHQVVGGLGGRVAEVLVEEGLGPLLRIGVKDKFGKSGSFKELYKKYGLDQESLYKRILGFVKS